MIARATMPADSKKFLVSRLPGQRDRVDAEAPSSVAHARHRVEQQLAHTDRTRARLDVEVRQTAPGVLPSASASTRRDRVADDDVVDRADQRHRRPASVIAAASDSSNGSMRASRRAQTVPPFVGGSSAIAARASSAIWETSSASRGRTASTIGGSRSPYDLSWAILFRIVLRPRLADS